MVDRENFPVVLIAGMQGTSALWDDVLHDVPSAWPLKTVMVEDGSIADAARAVLRTAGERILIAGHSLGGVVALAAARLAPERVAGLLLISTNPRAPSDAQRAEWLTMLSLATLQGLERQIGMVIPPMTASQEIRSKAVTMARDTGPERLAKQLAAQLSREDERGELSRFVGPLTALGGARDALVPPARILEDFALNRGADVRVHPNAGHLLPLEDPWWVASNLAAWRDRCVRHARA